MGIKGNMGINGEDDDQAYKTHGAKSAEYGNNNINSKVKNLMNKGIFCLLISIIPICLAKASFSKKVALILFFQ